VTIPAGGRYEQPLFASERPLWRMIPKKPAPDLIRGGHRFSDKIMRKRTWKPVEESNLSWRASKARVLPLNEPAAIGAP
jgi:hypothetical protein